MQSQNTIKTTNTLKGIAISAVLINHYLNLNVLGNYTFFANQWISIFFILSGYGLFYSLNRHFETISSGQLLRKLLLFYYQRSIRIYPLLWSAWLIELIVRGGNLSFWIPSGIHGEGHYWFIPALLQCYLLAPLIYWGIKKKPIILIITLMSGFSVVNLILLKNYDIVKELADFTNSEWRGMYFLYILVFSFGFLIPYIIDAERLQKYNRSISHSIQFWFFTFCILILMIILKYYGPNNPSIKMAFDVIPLFLIALLCIYSLVFSIENKVFSFLGNISYSIYLFHGSFYLLLNRIGGFPKNSIKEFIWFLVIFPAFIIACNHLEKFGNYINMKLKAQPGASLDTAFAPLQPRQ